MDVWGSRFSGQIFEGHVHMWDIGLADAMLAVREAIGAERMGFVAIQEPATGSGLPEPLFMKACHPDWAYVFAGLNHAERLSGGKVVAPSLAAQAEEFVSMGCDGIKMIEGKPTSRQVMDVPVTDFYFAEYWAKAEEVDLPIVWHVNDPEEFWDPELTPGWAKERDWGYGPEDVQKETLYAEVDEILARHPRLRVVFAHFYFLSADLPRAARFLEKNPRVSFDLAPGIEMLYNISRDPDAGREFFIRFADRIVFGSDQFSKLTPEQARFRAGIVYRWLETEDTFRVPDGADFLLGPAEDGVVRGMALPDDVLTRIYHGNITRLVGDRPKRLDVPTATEVCERLSAIAGAMSGVDPGETEAGKVAARLRGV